MKCAVCKNGVKKENPVFLNKQTLHLCADENFSTLIDHLNACGLAFTEINCSDMRMQRKYCQDHKILGLHFCFKAFLVKQNLDKLFQIV